ncbi:MAG TPA: GNAT family N-acetyltransferase [Kofleriaceae bacterium]|nr:GNAT family N-acetyltransferase [Kofleriaceae bacterium]
MGSPVLLDLPDAIDTERMQLRSPLPGDGAALNAAILDTWDSLHRWMPWARERPSVEDSEQRVRTARAEFLTRADLSMLMVLRDGTVIGGTGLHRMNWAVPQFEIGYWVRRTQEGQGYVSEAVRALSRFALGGLGAQRVEIHCSHRNVRSQRVAERCGYVLEGRLRNRLREPDGELRDTLIYSLIPDDPAARGLLD